MTRSLATSFPVLAFMLGACTVTDTTAESSKPPTWPTRDAPIVRVGGDRAAQVTSERATKAGEELAVWRYDRCAIDTPLPEGYPAPTPPGAIELKLYPRVRRAEVDEPQSATAAFYPLLNHIQSRSIAMTSPVEMDFAQRDGGLQATSMSFLYRRAEQGSTGAADARVFVRDREETLVLSIGVRGPLGPQALERALNALRETLAREGLSSDGSVRTLEYNSPFVPQADRWAEVQMPVTR